MLHVDPKLLCGRVSSSAVAVAEIICLLRPMSFTSVGRSKIAPADDDWKSIETFRHTIRYWRSYTGWRAPSSCMDMTVLVLYDMLMDEISDCRWCED